MRRTILALGAAGIVIGAVVAVAVADTGSASDPARDVQGNPPGRNSRSDIIKVAYGHGANGTVVQTVKTRGRIFGPSRPGTPLLWIDVPGKVAHRQGCNYSDYSVLAGEIDECGEGPKVGDATEAKVSRRKIRITFDPSAIGDPSKYGIAFVTEGSVNGKLAFFDRAPNHGWLVHDLP